MHRAKLYLFYSTLLNFIFCDRTQPTTTAIAIYIEFGDRYSQASTYKR
ncbi:MAG: hypothetical protein IM597_17210 [Pseudanabaena sp. M176S2SP2A07QC]|nr:hypothetical protein [Pseudanabaena sp. M176S2SP2A07QC]MCA6564789.1 hypothetical protein [Pseudanabaena sp. M151S2SP2A07QC]MCA6579711.1 hypothetical protein [Pseudanabaena sp. M085S1SP2A07QC]